MTPFELDILLHYYTCVDDHPAMLHAPIWHETIGRFLVLNLLKDRDPNDVHTAHYATTERCHAYIEALLRMPLPVQKWVIEPCVDAQVFNRTSTAFPHAELANSLEVGRTRK